MDILINILIAAGCFAVLGIITGILSAAFPKAEKQGSKKAPKEEKRDKRAFVRCAGKNIEKRYTFSDTPDCATADTLYGGATKCRFACLGMGTCAAVCPRGAILMKDGIAVVDALRCDGCGKCAEVCPRGIIELIPENREVNVLCRSTEEALYLEKMCDTGCIGCSLCVNNCEYGAISVEDNLAVIDYEKCTACGKCAEVCPRGIIVAPKVEEDFDENEYFEISEELATEKE